MVKNVNVDVPCAHLVMKAGKLEEVKQKPEGLTIHLVPVPAEALAEVQEVLKKYQGEFDRFNEALKKAQS